MNKQQSSSLVIALLLMAGSAAFLVRLRSHQTLGLPGVRTHALPGSRRLEVDLPKAVLNYTSAALEVDQMTLDILPQDTSFGQRGYTAADGFQIALNVVLMGSDRTSIHKPQFCLEGMGWHIDEGSSCESAVHVERPCVYELPVMKLVASRQAESRGQTLTLRRVYVYWFVAENAYTARHGQRMWWMARELLRTGVLQRWAYVTCSAICLPGQEDATFERLKEFIATAVPEFQLTPKPAANSLTARQ